jgi:phage shock protein PspC (stress-responsive transcriptional regulator)
MSTDTHATSAPPPGPGYPPLSAMRRSRSDRKIAGVAGGLGRWAGIDPLVFRILFVVLAIFGGSGLLLYALGWLLVPDDGQSHSEGQKLLRGRGGSSTVTTIVAGVVVLILGLVLIGKLIDTGPGVGGLGVMVAIVVIAILLIREGQHRPSGSPAAEPPPAWTPPPAEPGEFGQTPGTAYATPPPAYASAPAAPPPSYPTAPMPYPYYSPPPPAPPRERSVLGRVTLSVALIVVGLLIAVNIETHRDVPAEAVLAAALGVVGLGLVVGAFIGRARGLVVWGVLLTIAVTIASFAHLPVKGGVGDRSWTPRTLEQVHANYRLAIGDARLDLSRVDFTGVARQRVQVRQGVGDLTITVPSNVVVRITGHVHGGDLIVPGERTIHGSDLRRTTTLPIGSAAGSAVLVVDAELGVGTLEVDRA